MSIKYDIYETPSSDNNTTKLHVRAVSTGTVNTGRLIREIENSTSLTAGDILSVLTSLSNHMTEHLLHSEQVHLDGLGYFKLLLKAPAVEDARQIRAEHVKVRTVHFTPEKKLKNKFNRVQFVRTRRKNHSSVISMEDICKLLDNYFSMNSYITRAEFQKLCGLTKSTATARINRLIKEGKLIKGGIRNAPIYEPVREMLE